MFFRRVRPHVPTFEEKIERARQAGFTGIPSGAPGVVRLTRDGFGADVTHAGIRSMGLLVDNQIAALVDEGFQKFWHTSAGRRQPAIAAVLTAFHNAEEDLKEALGLESYYNESLGTRFDRHMYDRVGKRDLGLPRRPWERPL
ncbi:MAG: hypothetical protein IT160_09480 [Bryobacterales bacterium]|nr:hypothetical protein [Bryobacterales bacterium]